MPATTIPTFTDFLTATKKHKITSATEILNAAQRNTYLFKDMTKGRDVAEIVRGGTSIKDTIMLSEAGSFRFYNPHATQNPSDVDTLQDIEAGWRFAVSSFSYSEEIIALNEGDPEDIFVSMKKKYRQQAMTDMWHGMEDALLAPADAATMETASGEEPPAYSIWAFVNDQTYGLPSGFTTIMGVNPTNEDRWRPQQATYDSTNPADEETGLLAAFDDMFLSVNFESPDDKSEYFENDRLRKMKIITNKDGRKLISRIYRAGNDRYVNPQDAAYMNPTFAGLPVKYIATLNTALLDSDGTAWDTNKPRFLWLNLEYLFPIFHTKGYMEQVGPMHGGIRQPFSYAVFYRTWYNLFCRARNRQGCGYPA